MLTRRRALLGRYRPQFLDCRHQIEHPSRSPVRISQIKVQRVEISIDVGVATIGGYDPERLQLVKTVGQ